MNTFSTRLKFERLKLGLNQTELAEKGGVRQQSQTFYENGKRAPDLYYLQGIAKAGADIQFIVTGEQKVNKGEIIKTYGDIFEILDATLQSKSLNLPAKRKREAADIIYKEYCATNMNIQSMVNIFAKSA